VSTARVTARTFGTRYGPVAWIGTRLATVGPHDEYAPVLKSPLKSNALSRPSACTRPVAVISAGWRLVLDCIDSGRLVDQAHRAAELPRGDREQRLHRDVELAAEAAADRRRDDVHLLRGDRQHVSDLVTVHVRRLRAGEDAHRRGAPDAEPSTRSAQPASGSMYACST
jgi:hypothetical protein